MKNHWKTLGTVVFLAGTGVVVFEVIRRYFYEKNKGTQMPFPDKVIGGSNQAVKKEKAVSAPPSTPAEAYDKDMPDHPPEPPAPEPLALSPGVSFDIGTKNTEDRERLWSLLQNESFRQRGEGFRSNWAFHVYASKNNLGAPVARTASKAERVDFGGKQYGFQVFAGDTLFNEIPQWSKVQSLHNLVGGTMPESGLQLALLEASYRACGTELHTNWSFHHIALEKKLGPAMSDSYRITVDGQEYSMQVFALDTLYTPVPNWSDVRLLSETPAGNLYQALMTETYKVADSVYDPNSSLQKYGAQNQLGTPLSGVYDVDMAGTPVYLQVFAKDTVYALHGRAPARASDLTKPALPDIKLTPSDAEVSSADDALSSRKPSFAMLPVAGQPRISQLYGYTKWAAGGGRQYYGACQGRHPGIDFAVPVGTPLLAIDYGVVVCAGRPGQDCPFGGCPPMLAIVRYGNVYAIYGHASAVKVQKGDRVEPGQVVCLSGDYGGPHLHFEMRPVPERMLGNQDPFQAAVNPGYAVNPLDYFNNEMNAYFDLWYNKLGGRSHFCVGSIRDQDRITFAGPVDYRPCSNS